MNRNLLFFIISFFIIFAQPASAQESVGVRTGEHNGYTRAVFDWPNSVGYELVRESKDQILISFDKPASLTFSNAEYSGESNILKLSEQSAGGEALKVRLNIQPNSEYRHFVVGNKIVLDVIGSKKGSRLSESKTKPREITKKEDQKVVPEQKSEVATAEQSSPPEDKKEALPLEKVAYKVTPHVITVATTEGVGLAVFKRFEWLWVVMDRVGVSVPPKIEGPHAEQFPPFEKQDLKGGTAFRMKLPDAKGFHIYGEGGGLIWRIVLTPNPRPTDPVAMERSFVQGEKVRGGTAIWPLKYKTKSLDLLDPSAGDILKIVTVEQADQYTLQEHSMVDFDVLPAFIGLVVKPKSGDVTLALSPKGVEIGKPGGLALSREKDVNRRRVREDLQESQVEGLAQQSAEDIKRIFDFDRWMMGGLQALRDNQKVLLSSIVHKDKQGRVQDMIALAKMNVANDRGEEATGYLSYAETEMPEISDSAEFKALRGAAHTLSGDYESALQDLLLSDLNDYTELDYWRAYNLAQLGDWTQAAKRMPKTYSVLVAYPQPLLEKIGLKLAEISLRNGDVSAAEAVLAVLKKGEHSLWPWTLAGINYLKGEAHRQSGEYDLAKSLWEPLTKGKDDFYRARAGLALTLLGRATNDMEVEQAIDRLEGLRYAWRGDELEARINFLLGKLYLEEDQYLKGFTILRDAVSMSPDTDISREITAFMKQSFKDVLLKEKELGAVDAVSVYEEFRELTPPGQDGELMVQKLAERLVEADLLPRSADILQHQVDYRLEGKDKARIALRLATIYVLDSKPDSALSVLDTSEEIYQGLLSGAEKENKIHEINLLRAQSLSQKNQAEEALELLHGLKQGPDVNKIRASIAWEARLWEDAAEALHDLILDEGLDLNRPLTTAQTDLILNRAVALNLSSNRVALANMRKRYGPAMKKTPRSRLFDVVTRMRKTAIMADRQTIESIVNEVDMFRDFLDSYRQGSEEGTVSN